MRKKKKKISPNSKQIPKRSILAGLTQEKGLKESIDLSGFYLESPEKRLKAWLCRKVQLKFPKDVKQAFWYMKF